MTKCIKKRQIAKDKVKGKTLNKGSELMIKKIAWDTFKNTGDINAFIELKQIEDIEKGIETEESSFSNDINLKSNKTE